MMQVIGAGYGRTGTLSLQMALHELGVKPCYHMQEVIKRPKHVKLWTAVSQNQPIDWHHLFAGYEATVDYPASIYYKELMAAFPDAKVILTVRDSERWYESTLATIFQTTMLSWIPRLFPPFAQFSRMVDGIVWDGVFNGRFAHRSHAIHQFNQHIEEVKRVVPSDKLLVFSVKEGWEPLCQFLDKPLPDKPFPHANDRAMMTRLFKGLKVFDALIPWAGVGMLFGMLWVWLMRKWR